MKTKVIWTTVFAIQAFFLLVTCDTTWKSTDPLTFSTSTETQEVESKSAINSDEPHSENTTFEDLATLYETFTSTFDSNSTNDTSDLNNSSEEKLTLSVLSSPVKTNIMVIPSTSNVPVVLQSATEEYNDNISDKFANKNASTRKSFYHHMASMEGPDFISVIEYMYVEPVDCSFCESDRTCDGIDKGHDMPNFDNIYDIRGMEYSGSLTSHVQEIITRLGFKDKGLHELYNQMITASKTFACTLDERTGEHALRLSKLYNGNRYFFVETLKESRELIKNQNAEIYKSNMNLYDPYSSDKKPTLSSHDFNFVVKLFEENLNFSRNVTGALKLVTTLINKRQELKNNEKFINNITDHSFNPDAVVLYDIVKNLTYLEAQCNSSLNNINYFKLMLRDNSNLRNVFNTPAIIELTDFLTWKSKLEYIVTELDYWMIHLDSKLTTYAFSEKSEKLILAIMYIIGFLGNGLLLIVFTRHNEVRMNPNIMLLNIGFTDIIFLIVNIPAFFVGDNFMGEVLCKVYYSIRSICTAVNVYSLVMISVQRFVTLSVFFKRGGCLRKQSKSVLIIFIWLVGCIVALPYGLLSGIGAEGSCYDIKYKDVIYHAGVTLFDVIMLCILPVCLITVFNGLTVDEPEHMTYYEEIKIKGHKKINSVGVLASDIVVGLSFVFAVTYLPFYVFRFSFIWSDTKVNLLYYQEIVEVMPFLLYLNACLNPIALYISSKRYRSYFNLYILCRKGEASINIGNNPRIVASTTTIESTL